MGKALQLGRRAMTSAVRELNTTFVMDEKVRLNVFDSKLYARNNLHDYTGYV